MCLVVLTPKPERIFVQLQKIRRMPSSLRSYGTFSTGINIRNLHNIVFSSPSKSRVRTLQSIGRGLRRSETKDRAILFDIADDFTYKSKRNFTINHFMERINIYNEEQFDYEIKRIKLK
jgi:superfamily II DNA or RNA helicase